MSKGGLLSFRLGDELRARVFAAAGVSGLTVQQFIEMALLEIVKKYEVTPWKKL